DRDLVIVSRVGGAYSWTMPRAEAERWIADLRRSAPRSSWTMTPTPSCSCCGAPAWANRRCTKHQDRNPCLVEGCTRTRRAPDGRLADDQVICGQNWRAYVPPRSMMRRAYNAHWRRAKRIGWNEDTIEAYERFWDALARRVRRQASEGVLD